MEPGIILTVSISITYIAGVVILAPLLKKLKAKGYVGRDMYKPGNPPVPEMGGIGIAFAFLTGVIFLTSLGKMPLRIYPALFVLIFYFVFGLLDDLLGLGGSDELSHNKLVKMLVPLFFAFPLLEYVDTTVGLPTSDVINLGIVYLIIIVPFYVMVTANLVNMFSYYNGQSAGATVIILSFASLKLYRSGDTDMLYLVFPFLGATLAFLSYNLQPAGVFPGDSGDLFMGAIIGVVAVMGNLDVFIFIAMLPLSINFIMVAYWFLKEKRLKTKFGDVRYDGTIIAPNPHTLMWFFPYHLRLTEKQTTLIMYALVSVSSLSAWMVC
ncbi:MAG: hypothetical protein R6U17_01590 [Thermoplasmata archaeon]